MYRLTQHNLHTTLHNVIKQLVFSSCLHYCPLFVLVMFALLASTDSFPLHGELLVALMSISSYAYSGVCEEARCFAHMLAGHALHPGWSVV